MSEAAAEIRVHEIKTRRLEIAATLAEWKRAWFVDGIERPLSDRMTLEAEAAQLVLEEDKIKKVAFAAKLVRQARLRSTLHHQLIALLVERGMQDVIEEAKRRSELDPEGREHFEDQCMTLMRLKRENGKHIGADNGVPVEREALFWRKPNGEYGVEMFNAAWQGYQWGAQR